MNLHSKYISTWLILNISMVILMIIIGGVTRLTDSGLSMVEWRPIMGFLPPISELDWKRVFDLYKSSPEYIIKNNGMSLSNFKEIFFWEYFHRLWGRLIGIVFIIPFIILIIFKKIPISILPNLFLILFLGGLQAIIGWWMVKSGLVNDPSVSQYRLVLHLSNAMLILFLLVWTYLELTEGHSKILLNFSFFIFFVVSITIIAGAFVAGMNAGLMYNEYPMMGGSIIPENYGEYKILDPFENPASAQFHHRWLGALTFGAIIVLGLKGRGESFALRGNLVLAVVSLQFTLGIVTLLHGVPVSLGGMHQAGAVVLLGCLLALLHGTSCKFKKASN